MSRDHSVAGTVRPEEDYTQADAAWQRAFDHYLQLAREEASAARLRAAAAAVHAAALRKGRLADATHGQER